MGNELRAITTTSANEVWAVGNACVDASEPADIVCRPLALNLAGGVWRVIPPSGGDGAVLVDVAARSPNERLTQKFSTRIETSR